MLVRILLFLLSLTISLLVQANASYSPGPRLYPASVVGDNPMLPDINILHEDLILDFSHVGENLPVSITAVYEFECLEYIELLPLVFIAINKDKNPFTINIDGIEINADSLVIDSIPSSWQPPDSVQWKNMQIPYIYNSGYDRRDNSNFISFKISNLQSGKHTLKVSYLANVSHWWEETYWWKGSLSKYFSLVYILKPEPCGWKSFHNLDLNVILPNGCEYYSNLELHKVNTDQGTALHLHGRWPELPGSYVSIVLHKDDTLAKILSFIFLSVSAILVIYGISYWLKKRIKRSLDKSNSTVWFVLFFYCLLIALIFTIVFFLIFFINDSILNGLMGNYFNPKAKVSFYVMLASPFLFLLSFVIIYIVSIIMNRFIRKRLSARNNM